MGLYQNNNGSLNLLAGSTAYADAPIGAIYPYGGSTAPQGFLICDGTELLRTEYPALFAVIGTSFGTPSDETKFKLPDLRESTVKGTGLTSNSSNHLDSDGLALGEFIDDRLKDFVVPYSSSSSSDTAKNGVVWLEHGKNLTASTTLGDASSYGATTEVKAVGVNFIIKALEIALPTDFEDAVDEKIAALDVASVGGSGKYISAISETDGKISATATNLSTTPTSGSVLPITSGGVYSALQLKYIGSQLGKVAIDCTNVNNYTEIVVVCRFFTNEKAYIVSQTIPVYMLSVLGASSYAFGFGGPLNSATPYGARALIALDSRYVTLQFATYDNNDVTGNTTTYVFAR